MFAPWELRFSRVALPRKTRASLVIALPMRILTYEPLAAARCWSTQSAGAKAAVIMQGARLGQHRRGLEQAALLLAKLDHKPAADRLVELLKDSRAEVAITAAWALRVLAEPKSLPKVLDYFSDYSRVKPTGVTKLKDTELDRQLSHLGAAPR